MLGSGCLEKAVSHRHGGTPSQPAAVESRHGQRLSELLDVAPTRAAVGEVLLKQKPLVVGETALHPFRELLDELDASNLRLKHQLTAADSFKNSSKLARVLLRARCSSTRWLA